MKKLVWPIDVVTKSAATEFIPYKLLARKRPSPQYDETQVGTIINCLKSHKHLEAVRLVILWGGMSRTRPLSSLTDKQAFACLSKCFTLLERGSIEQAWKLLDKNMGWSNVMISKTLHFMARAQGYTVNPPAILDNASILNVVWPIFKKGVGNNLRPRSWRTGKGEAEWAAYTRYMTAINSWAKRKRWSTTQIEATLFGIYR